MIIPLLVTKNNFVGPNLDPLQLYSPLSGADWNHPKKLTINFGGVSYVARLFFYYRRGHRGVTEFIFKDFDLSSPGPWFSFQILYTSHPDSSKFHFRSTPVFVLNHRRSHIYRCIPNYIALSSRSPSLAVPSYLHLGTKKICSSWTFWIIRTGLIHRELSWV